MVTTIESLPNELLERIFSFLGDLPSGSIAGRKELFRKPWIYSRKDVIMLSCVSKRFHAVGKAQRVKAVYFGKETKNPGFSMWSVDQVLPGVITHLSIMLLNKEDAIFFGQYLHRFASLEHLLVCGEVNDESRPDFGEDFCEAVATSHGRPPSYRLTAVHFHFLGGYYDFFWNAIAVLKVGELMIEGSADFASPGDNCPSIQSIMVKIDSDDPMAGIWARLPNLQEIWLTQIYEETLEGLGASVQTIGTFSHSAPRELLLALTAGSLPHIRYFIFSVPARPGGVSARERYRLARLSTQLIDHILKLRGGKAETIAPWDTM